MRCILPVSFAVIALCLRFGTAVAQSEEPQTPAAEQPQITAIAPAYIPEQADQDDRFVQRVLERSVRFDPDGELAAGLTRIHQDILRLASAYSRNELASLTAPHINSLEKYWDLHDRRLDRWQADLQTYTARYSVDAADLARRRAAWEATLQSSTDKVVTPALLERINDIIQRLGTAQTAISAPLDQAIDLGQRGNQVRDDLDRGMKAVHNAIHMYMERLWMIDMPPLWQVQSVASRSVDPLAAENAGISVESSFLKHFLAEKSPQLLAFAFAWLAMLPLFLWFAWWERQRRAADGDDAPAAPILHRPISGWILLGALILPVVFAEAPVGLQQAALLVGLVPMIRLLPVEVFKLLRWLPYAIVGLYFIHRTRVIVWDDPLYYRLHLLILTILTASMVLWLLVFPTRHPSALQGRRRTLLRVLGWVGVAALMMSAIANVVGNVSLAEMLAIGVLESTYIGLAIYAGVSALLAMGSILLAEPAAGGTGFVARNVAPLRSGLRTLIVVAAIVLWLVVTINEFQIYRPTAEWLTALLTRPLQIGQLRMTLGGVLLFLFGVWAALWIARTVRVLLQNEVLAGMRLPPGVANSVASLTYYALIVIGLLAALVAAGFELGQLTIVLGALSVGIGLGLQNVVGNFVSGLILMFERPIRPGDVVEIGGTTGRVREIGMRATTLQTFEGADVVVPNGTLLAGNLTNWTLNNTNRRVDLDVGVSYSVDPPAVQRLLAQVARTIPGISSQPEPVVLFLRFNSSSLDFGIRAWTSDFDNWRTIQSALGVGVHRALKEAGIEIPFPQQDLHVRSIGEDTDIALGRLKRDGEDRNEAAGE